MSAQWADPMTTKTVIRKQQFILKGVLISQVLQVVQQESVCF
jgi:hypothetical protein